MEREGGDRLKVVAGVVIPCERDEEERVLSVAISAMDEKEYIIENRLEGAKLRECLQEQVRARGRVRSDKDGKTRMTVESYEILSADGDSSRTKDDKETKA